ncbi:hypothetical protein ACFTZB_45060, partial [Rhodococcus sp. NPDC057014]
MTENHGATRKPIRDGRWARIAENWIAVVFLMAAIIGAALFITALGGGFAGWALIAAAVTMALLIGGILAA